MNWHHGRSAQREGEANGRGCCPQIQFVSQWRLSRVAHAGRQPLGDFFSVEAPDKFQSVGCCVLVLVLIPSSSRFREIVFKN